MDWTTVLGLLNPQKWVEKVWGYLRRPKLRLYFDPKESYHTRLLVGRGDALGYFTHLMVSNEGKQIAKNCRGRLIEVSVPDSRGRFERHPDFVNPVVLKWAHEMDFDPKDVEPDIPKRLDLCYTDQSMPGLLIFFTKKVPTGNRTDFPPGTYRVKVRVDAENAEPVDDTFVIDYGGVWNQIQVSEASSK